MPNVSEFRESIAALLFEVRQLIKEEKSERIKEMKILIKDDRLVDSIMGQAEKLLIHYRAMEPLRLVAKEDSQLCKRFIRDAMDHYIVRYDWKWGNQYESYGFVSNEKMKEVLGSLDILTDYYVGNAIAEERIVEDFIEETNLSKDICNYYTELVSRFYQEIKLNLIFENIELLDKRIKKLEP